MKLETKINIEISLSKQTIGVLYDLFTSKSTLGVLTLKSMIPETKQDKKVKTRKCATCGKEFTPTSNAQIRCSIACGMKPKWTGKKSAEPIEQTIEEVERIRKTRDSLPYQFDK